MPNSGMVIPFSHRDTLLEETPNLSASSSCVMSFSFRRSLKNSPILTRSITFASSFQLQVYAFGGKNPCHQVRKCWHFARHMCPIWHFGPFLGISGAIEGILLHIGHHSVVSPAMCHNQHQYCPATNHGISHDGSSHKNANDADACKNHNCHVIP